MISGKISDYSGKMSEIDLTLALQLQAQFEEEARVSLLKQLANEQHTPELAVTQGNTITTV